jgi:hypothetical protein
LRVAKEKRTCRMGESFEYFRIMVLQSASGEFVRLVVGVPISTILELQKDYRDRELDRARDPRVNQTILSDLSKPETQQLIRDHLHIRPGTDITFQWLPWPEAGPLPADYDRLPATFVSPDGKKFWIEQTQNP